MTDNSEGKPSRYFRIVCGLYELTSLWFTDLSAVLTDFLVDLFELLRRERSLCLFQFQPKIFTRLRISVSLCA